MWPGTSPIGLRVRYPWTTVTVVGIVRDVRRETLGAAPELVFYVPFSQFTRPDVSFAVRTLGDPAPVVPRMRDAVWSVDEDLAITHSGTMDSLISQSASDERYRTILMAMFGVLASTLAAVGVFGVTARSVSLRTKEMGIRMALGQRRTGLVSNILRGSLALGTLGTIVGIAVALWASKAVSGLLFGVETSDPITYAAVAGSLLVLCLVASYLPARRIAQVDPVDVLRAE
jgi:ABC-type antimicrobial peptide transport system permease subunit